MIYYKILDENQNIQGFVDINDFRFYHPYRKRMFITTELSKAQYVIFQGNYYTVEWLAEAPELIGIYPKINIQLSTEEEYKEYLKDKN